MRWLALLIALLATPASADLFGAAPAVVGRLGNASVTPPFLGVGTYDANVQYFFGIVGLSAASAATNPTAIDITNNAGITCTGIKITTAGYLDTGSGTTYCTGSVTVNSACSTNCIVGGTFRVTKWYDQVGTGATLTTSAYSASPDFVLSGPNGRPCWLWVSARSSFATSSTISGYGAPYTVGSTYERTSNFTSNMDVYHAATAGLNANSVVNSAQGQNFGATGSPIAATVPDGSGTSDFSHFATVIFTVATGGSGTCAGASVACIYPPAGAAATQATFSFTQNLGTTFTTGGNSSFADMFQTKIWISNAAVSNANALSITGLSAP